MYRTIGPEPSAAAEATVLTPMADTGALLLVSFSIAVRVGWKPCDRYDGVHPGGLPPAWA
jgi:hypothetical protein